MARQRPILSAEALADLDEIWLYIARDSPSAADRVIDEIYAAIYQLAERPGAGHLREDLIDEPLRFWNSACGREDCKKDGSGSVAGEGLSRGGELWAAEASR